MNVDGPRFNLRLTAGRDTKAFLNKAIGRGRLHRPVSICANKAPTFRNVIREMNRRNDPHSDHIARIDRRNTNNRFESDHAALERPSGCRQSFRSPRPAKATMQGMLTMTVELDGLKGEDSIAELCRREGIA